MKSFSVDVWNGSKYEYVISKFDCISVLSEGSSYYS